jgi:hypothetical protein
LQEQLALKRAEAERERAALEAKLTAAAGTAVRSRFDQPDGVILNPGMPLPGPPAGPGGSKRPNRWDRDKVAPDTAAPDAAAAAGGEGGKEKDKEKDRSKRDRSRSRERGGGKLRRGSRSRSREWGGSRRERRSSRSRSRSKSRERLRRADR